MNSDISYLRLESQKLASSPFMEPEKVVTWFGAMQSQDFAAAKWGIALRTTDLTDSEIEHAFNEGRLLRTHIMRPTWHFVTPADIRWMLALTSPRVHKFNGYYYRRSGLDKTIFKKSNDILRKTLQGRKQMTRQELRNILEKHKIPIMDMGLSFTIMQAELDGVICSGPRIGKQFTYMLLDERVPIDKEISQEEALLEILKRYFQSHGPAQIKDFVWWSGLTFADAKKCIELAGSKITKSERDGKIYWCWETGFARSEKEVDESQLNFLLPAFDEYFIAYKDRSDILDSKYAKRLNLGGGMIIGAIVANGKMIGSWKRLFEKKNVIITLQLYEKITMKQQEVLEKQALRYGKFIGMSIEIKNIT